MDIPNMLKVIRQRQLEEEERERAKSKRETERAQTARSIRREIDRRASKRADLPPWVRDGVGEIILTVAGDLADRAHAERMRKLARKVVDQAIYDPGERVEKTG